MAVSVIGGLAHEVFPDSQISFRGDRIFIALQPGEEAILPLWVEGVVKANANLQELIKRYFAERKFEQISLDKLPSKIQKAAQKYLPMQLDLAATSTDGHSAEEALFLKMATLLSVDALTTRNQVEGKGVVLVTGMTGSGKSTTINALSGCQMERLSEEESALLGAPIPVIIARKPNVKVGYTGEGSTTRKCHIVPDAKGDIYYVDCPGDKDTRGVGIQVYNALSIMEVIRISKEVRGVLVLISWASMIQNNGLVIEETLRSLFLLLKTFTPHAHDVLFLITQAGEATRLAQVGDRLKRKVEKLVEANPPPDPFGIFCKQLLETQILDKAIVLSRPLNPESLGDIRQAITNFKPSEQKEFGYPISEKIEIVFGRARDAILSITQKRIHEFLETLKTTQKVQLEKDDSIACTQNWIDNLSSWLNVFDEPSLEHITSIASSAPFEIFPPKHLDQLRISPQLWAKICEIDPGEQVQSIDQKLNIVLTDVKEVLSQLCISTKQVYNLRVFEQVERALQSNLYMYERRSADQLEKMRKVHNIQNLLTMNSQQVCEVITSLFLIQGIECPTLKLLPAILETDMSKLQLCRQFIKSALWPLDIQLRPWKGTGSHKQAVDVRVLIPNISLSELLADTSIQSALKNVNLITVQVADLGEQKSVFVIDSDFKLENQNLTIQASCFEVKKRARLQVKEGSLTLLGRHMGQYSNDPQGLNFEVHPEIQDYRMWGWVW